MTKTAPQRYPGATTGTHWSPGRSGGTAFEANVGVLHTTEGRTVPTYGGGASAPTFTALPDIKARRLRWYQHFDFDVSSRALVNRSGGVETNSLNAVQVELVGTCDERHAETWDGKRAGVDYLFWPDAPDWAITELGRFIRWCSDNHGIRMQSTVTWKPYKKGQVGGSFGSNGVRLTGAAWAKYYGWLGHQHVPENDHGDPGDLPIAAILTAAKGGTPPEEDPMAGITKQDIYDAVWRTDAVPAPADASDVKTNPTWQAVSVLRDIQNRVRANTAAEAAQTAAITALAKLIGSGVDTNTVVAAVQKAVAEAVVRVDVNVTGKEA